MQDANIKVLRQMRAELMERVTAVDSVISLLERIDNDADYEPQTSTKQIEDEPLSYKGNTRNTKFESAIPISVQAEPEGPWICPKCRALNPVGVSVCRECKKKKPAGVRNV